MQQWPHQPPQHEINNKLAGRIIAACAIVSLLLLLLLLLVMINPSARQPASRTRPMAPAGTPAAPPAYSNSEDDRDRPARPRKSTAPKETALPGDDDADTDRGTSNDSNNYNDRNDHNRGGDVNLPGRWW